MNLDVNKILGLAKTFMPNKAKQLENAINNAQKVLKENEGKSPAEILQNTGISQDFIEKLRKNTSNPLANIFMNAVGIDVNQANNILDNIKGENKVQEVSKVSKTDDIENLKIALNKVRRK